MASIFETVLSFFKESQINFVDFEDQKMFQAKHKGQNGKFTFIAQVREKYDQVVFYSLPPLAIPETKLNEIMEFITRVNYSMIIGNFELDLEDCELRFKTSFQVNEASFTPAHIKPLVNIYLDIMDKYFPAIKGIVENNLTIKQAIESVESE